MGIIKMRPSSFVLLGLMISVLSLSSSWVQGTPIPDTNEHLEKVNASINEAVDTAKSFVDRAKNTFQGKTDANNPGLTPLEITLIVAAAVLGFFIVFCCIGYCICECVRELICCICCCSWCRD